MSANLVEENGRRRGVVKNETWHHDDAYLIESIKLGGQRLPANVGVSPMPAYDAVLSDEEITAVLD